MALPRPRLVDHLHVAWLLLTTILGVVPFLLHVFTAPFVNPRTRTRLREILNRPPATPDEAPAPDPKAWEGRTIFVVAGEASGDRLAARVLEAVRRRAPGVRVRGFAGPACAAAGATLDRSIVEHAVMGFFAVAASLPTWWRLCVEALALFRDERPDVLLTVDFPGLNLRLARWARRRGITTIHLVAPQTWAWAGWRTARLPRAVDRMLVTLPFEPAIFREAGLDTRYVGHPLFEAPVPPPASPEELPATAPVVELRPGSRRRDVRRQGPIVLDAAREIAAKRPDARLLVRLASERSQPVFREVLEAAGPGLPPMEVVVGPGGGASPLAVSLTTSGTSTAELAVSLVPMVVFYRVTPLGRVGVALFLTTPWFSLANLLAGRDIVFERLVGRHEGKRLAAEVLSLLEDPARWAQMRRDVGHVRDRVCHPGVADRCARAILDVGTKEALRKA